MSALKYLFRKGLLPLYFAASAVISLVFVLLAGAGGAAALRMLPSVLCILLMLRALDDYCDFEKDSTGKVQYLTKRALLVFFSVLAAVFVFLNVGFYGNMGLLSVLAIGYFLSMQKLPFLKMPCMALMFLYFSVISRTPLTAVRIAALLGCLGASAVYHILKRRGKK